MLQNNNKEIIKKLSRRSFKLNKTRNIVSILAIVLTTVLFTSLFTVGYSMLEAFSSYKFIQYGTDKHVQLQDVSSKQIEILKKSDLIDKNSIGIVNNISSLVNPEFSTQTVNLAVYDEQSVKSSINIEIVEGTLPKNKYDIVMPIEILDLMNLPHKIGTEVEVIVEQSKTGKTEKYKFKLSGYYKNKTINTLKLYDVFASDNFYNEYKSKNDIEPTSISFNFKSDKNLQAQYDEVLKEIQPYSGKSSLNPAYLDSQANNAREVIKNALPVVLMIVLILLSGYLLIYNIFYISVVKDIKHYGLLKTIGTSPSQLKKLVINQAHKLCLIGIPLGLVLGYILGIVFVPMVGNMINLNKTSFECFNPIIFICATIFSYITVRISCKKPSKIASGVSPIEAVRYSEKDNKIKKKSKKGKNGSKLCKMAIYNIFRNKKKAYLVLISMSLSCMIFLGVSTIISSSNPKMAADGMILDDIEIEHGNANIAKYEEKEIPKINENIINDIMDLNGVKSVKKIYDDSGFIVYEGDLKKEVLSQEVEEYHKDWIWDGKEPSEVVENHGITSLDIKGLSSLDLLEKIIESNNFNLNEKIDIISGSLDMDKFNKGGYVILQGHEGSSIKVGDKINLKYLNTNNKKDGYTENEFEVMAIIDGAKNFYLDLYVNENDFKKVVENPYIQKLVIDCDENIMTDIEKEVQNLNEKYNNPYTQVYTKRTYIEDAKELQMTITIIGMSAVFIIGLIGVLNFVNTMITSIIARKTEFAMIEAVGMTKKQLKKMLLLEGLYYGIIITISNITLGSLATILGFNIMKLRYSVYTYPLGALILCTIVVFLVSLAVPLVVYNSVNKDSIVDRIRVAE